MINAVINSINDKVKDFPFFEFTVLMLQKNTLTLAGSEDLIYFHNFEIVFTGVYAIIGNIKWEMIPGELCVELVSGDKERELRMNYWALAEFNIFKFNCEDTLPTYIIAKTIELVNKDKTE